MRRFAKPLYGLTPVPRVRIPPSPPDSCNPNHLASQLTVEGTPLESRLRVPKVSRSVGESGITVGSAVLGVLGITLSNFTIALGESAMPGFVVRVHYYSISFDNSARATFTMSSRDPR
jgi:hypothetical protein